MVPSHWRNTPSSGPIPLAGDSLAAAVAMIQTNILLSTTGRTDTSFANIDVMRLPLGILTGVGFIGGGSILRRGDIVEGTTTAATMWLMTVIGLCFGGGQLVLGTVATALTALTLWGLKRVDMHLPHPHQARIVVSTGSGEPAPPDLDPILGPRGVHSELQGRFSTDDGERTEYHYLLSWSAPRLSPAHSSTSRSSAPQVEMIEDIERSYELTSIEFLEG